MSERYTDLTKIPADPPAKLLAAANIQLKAQLDAPASAPAAEVLAELEAKQAWGDLLMALAVMLPPRERVWWACLAARDVIAFRAEAETRPLTSAEAWVFKPTEENREAARASLDNAYVDDDSVNCATAVLYADGTLGPGDLAQHPAPAGASELSAFAMNMVALGELSDKFETYVQVLIDRALDIARGGNGRVAAPAKEEEQTA
jgi:hypothetical protein